MLCGPSNTSNTVLLAVVMHFLYKITPLNVKCLSAAEMSGELNSVLGDNAPSDAIGGLRSFSVIES